MRNSNQIMSSPPRPNSSKPRNPGTSQIKGVYDDHYNHFYLEFRFETTFEKTNENKMVTYLTDLVANAIRGHVIESLPYLLRLRNKEEIGGTFQISFWVPIDPTKYIHTKEKMEMVYKKSVELDNKFVSCSINERLEKDKYRLKEMYAYQ